MTRDKLIKIKEAALDRMLLCYTVFAGNKPPRPEHAVELQAHAAFIVALGVELGERIAPEKGSVEVAVVKKAIKDLNQALISGPTLTSVVRGVIDSLNASIENGGCS